MEVGQNIVSNDKQTVVISVVFYFKEEEERKKKSHDLKSKSWITYLVI